MKLIIEIDEDVRIAIKQMGLLRIPDEMQKKVDKAIQHGTPIEQEPKTDVLDKIRAEIEQYLFENEFGSEYRKEIAQIIDKYKAESEDME